MTTPRRANSRPPGRHVDAPDADTGPLLYPSEARVSFRIAKREVDYVVLPDTVALRCREGSVGRVTSALQSLGGTVRAASQGVTVLELRRKAKREATQEYLRGLLADGTAGFVTPVLRESESQLRQILTDEITVRFRSNLPDDAAKTLLERYGVTIARQNEFVPRQLVAKVNRPVGLETLDVASRVDTEDEIEFAAPNFISEFRR